MIGLPTIMAFPRARKKHELRADYRPRPCAHGSVLVPAACAWPPVDLLSAAIVRWRPDDDMAIFAVHPLLGIISVSGVAISIIVDILKSAPPRPSNVHN